MIVYDVTNQNTFDNVNKWCQEIKDKASKNINLMMIGNKTDLKDKIVVNSEMSQERAMALGIPVMETSALDSTNVQEAFFQLLREMYKSIKANAVEKKDTKDGVGNDGVTLNTQTRIPDQKKSCC